MENNVMTQGQMVDGANALNALNAGFTTSTAAPAAPVTNNVTDLPFNAIPAAQAAPAPAAPEEAKAEETTQIVTLAISKTYPKELVDMIVNKNSDVQVIERDKFWVLNATFLRVLRDDVEKIIGKLPTVTKWKAIFINKIGESKVFSDDEFTLGVPKPVAEATQEKEDKAQMNVRIEKHLKETLAKFADMMKMSQNDLVETALMEYLDGLQAARLF